jgi:hypothetical protein
MVRNGHPLVGNFERIRPVDECFYAHRSRTQRRYPSQNWNIRHIVKDPYDLPLAVVFLDVPYIRDIPIPTTLTRVYLRIIVGALHAAISTKNTAALDRALGAAFYRLQTNSASGATHWTPDFVFGVLYENAIEYVCIEFSRGRVRSVAAFSNRWLIKTPT